LKRRPESGSAGSRFLPSTLTATGAPRSPARNGKSQQQHASEHGSIQRPFTGRSAELATSSPRGDQAFGTHLRCRYLSTRIRIPNELEAPAAARAGPLPASSATTDRGRGRPSASRPPSACSPSGRQLTPPDCRVTFRRQSTTSGSARPRAKGLIRLASAPRSRPARCDHAHDQCGTIASGLLACGVRPMPSGAIARRVPPASSCMTTAQPGRTSSPPRQAGRLLAWQSATWRRRRRSAGSSPEHYFDGGWSQSERTRPARCRSTITFHAVRSRA
jgi:hypothetical protein